MLQARRAAGWSPVTLDGTLMATDRYQTKNPDTSHELWYSGQHKGHGGNVQVICGPSGFSVAVSDVQPGSMHDLPAAHATGFLAALHAAATLLGLPPLADRPRRSRARRAHTGQGRPGRLTARPAAISC